MTIVVQILGMVPSEMIERSKEQSRQQFFEKNESGWTLKPKSNHEKEKSKQAISISSDPKFSLGKVIESEASKKKKNLQNEPEHSAHNYDLFVDFILQMLSYDPSARISPKQALMHPFIVEGEAFTNSSRRHRRQRRS